MVTNLNSNKTRKFIWITGTILEKLLRTGTIMPTYVLFAAFRLKYVLDMERVAEIIMISKPGKAPRMWRLTDLYHYSLSYSNYWRNCFIKVSSHLNKKVRWFQIINTDSDNNIPQGIKYIELPTYLNKHWFSHSTKFCKRDKYTSLIKCYNPQQYFEILTYMSDRRFRT